MGIRDDELQRLIKYAEAMGVRVRFRPKERDSGMAEWTLDGTEITIFESSRWSKTDYILALVHELGHHIWFIHEKDRQPDLRFDQAIERVNLSAEDPGRPVPKKLREKILSVEIAGTKYWETIWKDVNIKLPKWKLYAAMEFDIWMYEQYKDNGSFPTRLEYRNHWKDVILPKYEQNEYE